MCVCVCCRGVVRVDINLQDVDIDQCASNGWFAGTHRCNLTTMEVRAPESGLTLDQNWTRTQIHQTWTTTKLKLEKNSIKLKQNWTESDVLT